MKEKTTTSPKLTPDIIKAIEDALSQRRELKIKCSKNNGISVLDITAKRII